MDHETVLRFRGADRLAYECAKAIERGAIGSRSAIGDALLDYLQIGHPDGPPDVPTWIEDYEGGFVLKGSRLDTGEQ